MKIIILTQYYPPETGAPQNRLSDLARRLKNAGNEVTVHTAMPNYPQMKKYPGYRWRFCKNEFIDGIKVHRSWIYTGTSKKIIPRLFNYFSFVFTSVITGIFLLRRSDFLIVESPPLFLGISAWILSRFKGAKMIFNVSDLWPESAEKLGLVTNKRILGITYKLEKFCYRKSALVVGQTQGICKSIQQRFPQKKTHWFPNGVDMDIFGNEIAEGTWRKEKNFGADDFLILYAGIIGHAQGLEIIIKAAGLLKDQQRIKFIILGSGPEKDKLKQLSEDSGTSNVFFIDGVGRDKMPGILASVNASVIPLRKLELFQGAIPSKIFESLAMKKPILLGVEGEAKELFIDDAKAGLFFEPENHSDLAEQVKVLVSDKTAAAVMGENGRNYVVAKFNRQNIADGLMNLLKEIK